MHVMGNIESIHGKVMNKILLTPSLKEICKCFQEEVFFCKRSHFEHEKIPSKIIGHFVF